MKTQLHQNDSTCQYTFLKQNLSLRNKYILMKPQTYPEDYSCILAPQTSSGGLFIGNLEAAQSTRTLSKHSIKAILTAAKGVSLSHPRHTVPETLYIPGEDHDNFDLSVHFHKAADFIHHALQNTNIMVHCLAGVSRSVSLVLAYLIKYRGMRYQQAYSLVKAKRKIIHPNDGFIRQLKLFAQQHRRDSPPRLQPQRYASPQRTNQRDPHYHSISQLELRKSRASLSPSRYPHYAQQNYGIVDQDPYQLDSNQYTLLNNYTGSSAAYPSVNFNRPNISQIQQIQGKIKSMSSAGPPKPSQGYEGREFSRKQPTYLNVSKKIDTSEIDRKIEEIRKKYQDFTICSRTSNFNRQAGLNSNKREYCRFEQSKRRQYNYLNQLQRTAKRHNQSNYSYTQA